MQSDLDNIETRFQTDIYLHLIAFTFLCYDYLLTFETEIFFVDREYFRHPFHLFFNGHCTAWNIVQELFHALVGLMIATFLTLRIYALYGSIVTDLLASSTPMLSSIPSAGCHDILALKDAALIAVGWEALLVYDILLFGMTLAKAYQARYQLGTQHLRGMSLISVIIRDGTIYFAIMTLSRIFSNHELLVCYHNVKTHATPPRNRDSRIVR
ncbi:hypothetical protein DFH05DRAFT_185238 [Lentinula detonsa]|uniref:Uncharacterized protein n=1 Tax=Lentinula detonsa TaxID=2804962 RepID=A0A9W8U435_9AGAR|nr:hypothetical protein DFH05DRAFT_185238 [Lentinula detonsa]